MSNIADIVSNQRAFFQSKKTLDTKYRIQYLKKLHQSIRDHEREMLDALCQDLGKSDMEGFMCEIGLTLSELTYQIKHVKRFARKEHRRTDLMNFPARSCVVKEPYGIVLVMAPWNYPFLLTMEPVIGAIAAGNCVVVKPSAYSPNCSRVMATIIRDAFPPEYVAVVEGGRAENTELLEQRFDYIFFTGGVNVGKLVMEKAAKNLTPVTLELGGKSPCIIDKSANLKIAAKRLIFGKYLNCGQTCVAPDYVLIHESIRDQFVELLKKYTTEMYTDQALLNQGYGKIINEKHFDRLCGLMDESKVVYGGGSDRETLKIEPTIMIDVTPEDAIMQEEIFGPIMPILTFKDIAEAEAFVKEREKPLAFYIFSGDRALAKRLIREVPFGGGCINDTVLHMISSHMAFGGVGNSGMGSYHGRKSFNTFSHEKSILNKSTLIDMPMRYAPYKALYLKLVKTILR